MSEREEIERKAQSLLSSKLRQIKRLRALPVQDDLFGFAQESHDKKIERISSEIDSIQRGEVNFYYPVEQINNVKKWINN